VPFCKARCGYCDFNTYTLGELGSASGQLAQWADGVAHELELLARQHPEAVRQFSTIFIGGGTPSLIDPNQLANALAHAAKVFCVATDTEITAEANPESFTHEVAEVWAAAGVNRISFGMQSAVPHVLAELDRQHHPDAVAAAVGLARQHGISNVSLDLMYGANGESLADWQDSLEAAISLAPKHISAYALTVEKGTALGRRVRSGKTRVDDGDAMAAKYELADSLLSRAGYQWYEISNWAKPDFECKHNLGYWRNQDWFGVGPGAHSHVAVSAAAAAGPPTATRWWNVKHPTTWYTKLDGDQLPVQDFEELTSEQSNFEHIMLGLRLRDGLALDLPEWLYQELLIDHLIEPKQSAIKLTRRGRLLADTVTHKITSTCLTPEHLLAPAQA
jgi:oxygen-independent coproporphyrinogen-3 oxidase